MIGRVIAGMATGAGAGLVALGIVSLATPLPQGEATVARAPAPERPAAPGDAAAMPVQPAPLPGRAPVDPAPATAVVAPAAPEPESEVAPEAATVEVEPAPEPSEDAVASVDVNAEAAEPVTIAVEVVPAAEAPRPAATAEAPVAPVVADVDAEPEAPPATEAAVAPDAAEAPVVVAPEPVDAAATEPSAAEAEPTDETEPSAAEAEPSVETETVTFTVPIEAPAARPPVQGIVLPAGSEFGRAPDDAQPAAPDAAPAPSVGAAVPDLAAAAPSQPAPDTDPVAAPGVGRATPLGAAPEASDAPVAPRAVAEAPPATFASAEAEEDAPAAPEADAPEAATLVETTAARPSRIVLDSVDPEEAPVETTTEETGEASAEVSEDAPAEPVAAEPDGPRRILLDAARAAADQATDAARAATEAAPGPRRIVLDAAVGAVRVPAVTAHASGYRSTGRPLFAVVLIDDLGDGPEVMAERETLTRFPFPVTIALDPARPGAAEAADLYRAAGVELVMLADALPRGGTAQDFEVALEAARAAMPEAVALADLPGGALARDRGRLAAVLPALAETGHGLVTLQGGLGGGLAAAERAGVPATGAYRILDADGERASVITRYLDRAIFEAVNDGAVTVVGRARPDTVSALYAWALDGAEVETDALRRGINRPETRGSRSRAVDIAPLSAVLTRDGTP